MQVSVFVLFAITLFVSVLLSEAEPLKMGMVIRKTRGSRFSAAETPCEKKMCTLISEICDGECTKEPQVDLETLCCSNKCTYASFKQACCP